MVRKNGNNERPQNFSVDHIYEIHNISSIELSPDGRKKVLYNVSVPDSIQNCRNNLIRLISAEDQTSRTLAVGSSPCWSPDGIEMAYESEGGDLCILNSITGEDRSLTTIYHSVHLINHLEEKKFAWSPNGKFLAFLSTPPFSEFESEKEIVEINRLSFKSKGGQGRPFFNDNNLTHIYLIPVSGGEPELLTEGNYNEHSISWSPDSKYITFISNRSLDPDDNQFSDLWKVEINTKKVTRLTNNQLTAYQPAWSPDGKFIAYLATTTKNNNIDSIADELQLFVLPSEGGMAECLTGSLDRRIGNISWHPNGEFIYFTAENEGESPLYRISLKTKQIEVVINGKFLILEYSLGPNGEDIAYLQTTTNQPPEVLLTTDHGHSTSRLTRENDAWVNKSCLQVAETFWFDSFDGTKVQGWLMKPINFSSNKSYPLILVIHGGPHNMFGFEFEERMQILCTSGYAVLFINPRGSSGYGQRFSHGNLLNWGGGDYKDLMEGLDFATKNNKWINIEKLGVTGQSYGGYMSNWMIGQTNTFKAAVVDGGISNLISFSGTSLYHSLIESEFNGRAHLNYPLLWQWSPLRNVSNVKTPTLFLHGETDNEVPISQAEEMYTALKKCGVKTSFVQYIGEGHGWRPDLKPKNRYDLYNRMINWFNEFI